MDGKIKPPKYAYFAYKTERRASFLELVSKTAVAAVVVIYSASLLAISLGDILTGIGFAVVSGLSLAILSLSRKLLNKKRPYEIYDVSDLAPKLEGRRGGLSFPSRHVFSAFLIGTMLAFASPLFGLAVALLGILIALCRVILLIHFPRDVIAGALIGIAAGVIGALALEFLI